MRAPMKALFVNGKIDEHGVLRLDEPVTNIPPSRVGVVLLLPENTDISEEDWLRLLAANPALNFLEDPEEDVYSLNDGKPFKYEG